MKAVQRVVCAHAAALRASMQRPGRTLRCRAVAVLLALLTAPAAADPEKDLCSRIDDYVVAQMNATGVPGTAIAVARGAQALCVQGYGRDSRGEPVTSRTLFYAASLSKSMTALGVMQLVESGRISLDKPVHAYLPEFSLADPKSSEITVRQLLNQTSGMSDAGFFEWTVPGPASLHDATLRLNAARLLNAPGTRFRYHNPNYHVAARLVEVASGEPFATYMDRHVFKPLAMNSTRTVDRPDPARDAIAYGHVFVFGQPVAVPMPGYFLNGAAGVITNAEDLSRWLLAQSNGGVGLNGARILSAEGVAAMHAPSAPGGMYGLGWMVSGKGADRSVSHSGLVPTFTAYQAFYPADATSIAVLSNVGMTDGAFSGGPAAVADAIHRAVRGESPKASTNRTGLFVDSILAMFAACAVLFGLRGVARNFHRQAPAHFAQACVALLAMVLRCGLLVGILSAPAFVAFATGRAASWLWLLYIEPVLVVFLAVVGSLQVLLLVSRLLSLVRRSNLSKAT